MQEPHELEKLLTRYLESVKAPEKLEGLKPDLMEAWGALITVGGTLQLDNRSFAEYHLERIVPISTPAVDEGGDCLIAESWYAQPNFYVEVDADGREIRDEDGTAPALCATFTINRDGMTIQGRLDSAATLLDLRSGAMASGTLPGGEWTATLTAIKTPYDKKAVDYADVLTGAAMLYVKEKAKGRRGKNLANLIWSARYGIDIEEPPEVTTVTAKLAKTPYNHSFALKALKGYEAMAYSGESSYTLKAKSGKQKTVLRANNELVAEFIGKDGANSELAKRVAQIANELTRTPEAIAARLNGRVWISVNTIINELTRTTAGTNENLRRRAEYHDTVNACLRALSSSQFDIYSHDGNLSYSGYIMNAEYLAKITDTSGNVVRDVWGFLDTESSRDFAELMALQVSRRPPLEMAKPLNANTVWMGQYLEGDAISAIRAKLYPGKGKSRGLKSHTETRSLQELFNAAEPLADGNLESRRKTQILKDLEKVLYAISKQERNAERPIWIQAKATRDGRTGRGLGRWDSLVITGYKTAHKCLIGLSGDGHRPLNKPEELEPKTKRGGVK